MNSLVNKRVLLGITGGIAAYKSAELVRQLRTAGAEVSVVMTAAAQEFITPLTLNALSGQPVYCDWSEVEAAMGHIELARWADRILIAPTSADSIARLVQGRAEQLLDALCLASEAPIMLAPAMNRVMWEKPATQDNIALLRHRGFEILGPAEGQQACGETGPGRMLEPDQLCQRLADSFSGGQLSGLRVLVTAGPTREAIDPVRCLTNRSSGKTGYAIAEAALAAGAAVTLVSGPVALSSPDKVQCINVETAAQMLDAVMVQIGDCDIFIATAAVADYRPAEIADQKIKKQSASLQLELEKTTDVLATVTALDQVPFCVGFAAETEQLEKNARKKRLAKSLDLVVANLVGEGRGFDVDDNSWSLFWEGGSSMFEQASKSQLARRLIETIALLYSNKAKALSKHHEQHSA
jgi:phosphopantothenoylcysteine decarboxylase/phosphopantothenate--cysteine ligase